MKVEDKKVIMYDSSESAVYRTNIEGWVSSDGRFFGKGDTAEQLARNQGSTHKKCDCGIIMPSKSYSLCESCRNKKHRENYLKLPFKEYDGSPVFSTDDEKYFFDEESIIEYCADNLLDELDLYFAEPNMLWEITDEIWEEILPEDGEFPDELKNALSELNKVIKNLPAVSWSPSKVRTKYICKHN